MFRMDLNKSRIIVKVLSTLASRGRQAKLLDNCKGQVWETGICRTFSHNSDAYPFPTTKFGQRPQDTLTLDFRRKLTSGVEVQGKCIGEVENHLEHIFRDKDVSEPEKSAEYLIAHVIGEKTLHGTHPSTVLTTSQKIALAKLVSKRLTRMPIQYVLGEWDFRSLTLTLKPPVLVPRPETEELVGLVLENLHSANEGSFLEIGPGAGPICLSLLKESPQLTCVAVDASPAACDLTLLNAKKFGLLDRIEILNMPICEYDFESSGRFDFIVSNPPYLKKKNISFRAPEVKDFEDHLALDGGKDGLDVVREILYIAPQVLHPGGSVWLEVDSYHPDMIHGLVERKESLKKTIRWVESFRDFNKLERFCHLKTI